MDSGTGGTVRARSRQVLLLELGGAADTTRALQWRVPRRLAWGSPQGLSNFPWLQRRQAHLCSPHGLDKQTKKSEMTREATQVGHKVTQRVSVCSAFGGAGAGSEGWLWH